MTVLITGISGFVAHYLVRELHSAGHQVAGFDLSDQRIPEGVDTIVTGDITNRSDVTNAIAAIAPDACIHLAGIASPPVGREHPELMLNTNILGTARILEALREHAPDARFLFASTAYVYGNQSGDSPLSEQSPLRPNGIYAVSKAAADLMTLAYAQDYEMHAMTARVANHTGPGQNTDFVVPAFADQIRAIAAGDNQPIRVGNLESERSFLDVRDVVRAYRLLIERGQAGKAYNIGAPDRVSIGWLLETLADSAGITPQIEVDPERFRPTDRTPLLDTTLIEQATGWCPELSLRETLREMLYVPKA